MSTEIFSPAKINLFLAVTGERGDGFHELLSLVVPLGFGDYLRMRLVDGKDVIACDHDGLPMGGENIIFKAIKKFRERFAFESGVEVGLEKNIPMGAGLGGGSSNAVAALRGVNELLGGVLGEDDLRAMGVELGSDCRLFFEGGPVIMSGRGERVEAVRRELEERLKGQRVLIFKPGFSVNTGWAYEQMRRNPQFYIEREEARFILEKKIEAFLNGGDVGGLLYNNFEKIIFEEHGELKELMKRLEGEFGVKGGMSGSGSACFCMLKEGCDVEGIKNLVRQVLGKGIFMEETVLGC